MDSQDYLDQISASVRPAKKKSGLSGIFGSAYFKWGMLALVLLIVIILFGSMLGGKETMEEKCTTLKLRLDRDTEVISEYQPSVKSSLLRSLSASLKGIFTNTSSQLNTYMVQNYSYDEGKVKKDVIEEADLTRDALMEEMFEAKINGLLDRIFAHKMTLEIYTAMSDEASIINATSDEALKSLLTNSYDSLNNLYTQFNDFSETK